MTKDKVLNSLKDPPEEFELEALIERLISLQSVEEAMKLFRKSKGGHAELVEASLPLRWMMQTKQ